MAIPLIFYQIVNLLNAILSLLIGAFVLFTRKLSKQVMLFSAFAFLVCFWDFFYFLAFQTTDYDLSRFLFRTCMIAGTLILPVFTEFVYNLVGKTIKPFYRIVNFGTAALIILTIYTNLYAHDGGPFLVFIYWPIISTMSILQICHYGFNVFFSHGQLIHAYLTGAPRLRQQSRIILIGTSLGYLGAATNFLLWFRIPFPPVLNILIPIYVISVAYAIMTTHLMDIDIIIRKGIIYSALIASVVGVYAGAVFGLESLFQGAWEYSRLTGALIVAVFVAVGYRPLENYITNATDKIFFKKKYDYQKALKEISSAMSHLTNVDRLVDLTTRIIVRTMRLKGACVLIVDEKKKRFEVRAGSKESKALLGTTISDNYELVTELRNKGGVLVREEIEHIINISGAGEEELKRLERMREEMKNLNAAVCVPTFSKGKHVGKKLIAIMCLGEKLSQDMFTEEDINLLSTLSNQAAIALENAMLYDQQLKSRDTLIKQEKMAALGTMAAGIVHELKNPLAFISTVAQLMPSRWDDKEFKETTQKMLPEEAKRMQSIVESLLEYSRQKPLKKEPIDLSGLIDNVITMLAFETRKHGVDIIKDFKENPKIEGDHHRLMQVFINLCNNATQAMLRGGRVTISWADKGAQIAIYVADNGIGIPKESLRDIFNPFFTTKEGGTGLGLSITQKVIEEHKGTIKIDSEVGKGTTFTILLPIAV